MRELKNYINLYIGCECMIGDLNWKPETNLNGLAPGVDPNYGRPIRSTLDAHVLNVFVHETTLILRPVSDLTEEEAVEIAKIMYGQPDSVKWRMKDKTHYFKVYRKHYSKYFTIDKPSGEIDRYERDGDLDNLDTTMNHHLVTAYMVSCGFDLFGLIDAGLAIDKTKHPILSPAG